MIEHILAHALADNIANEPVNSNPDHMLKDVYEIAHAHRLTNNMSGNHDDLVVTMGNLVKQGFKPIRFNNVIFFCKEKDRNVLLAIINGDHPKQYINALRKMAKFLKNKGMKSILMYAQNEGTDLRLAQLAGLKNITMKHSGLNQIDPYVLHGEL